MVAAVRAGHHGCMESVLNALPRRLRALGWAALFPAVMCVCFVCWGARPWTWTAVPAAATVTLLAPAAAADLLAVALIGFASYAFALFNRDSTLPPGSGTTTGYPFHSVVFGGGLPDAVDLAAGLLMLAFGAWLVPRTIGAHSGLARRNSELLNRVRRLTITRVDALDTAATELRRIERDLHDGAQARLIALGISLRATERLIRTNPDAAVALVAESRENSARALLADQAGGVGYLLKDRVFTDEQFTDALRTVARGGTIMDPEVVAKLLARRSGQPPVARLTDRERQVLALMAEGRSNSAIAQRLVITEKAVSKHCTSIFAKLDLPPSDDDNRRVLAVLAYLDS
jgi:DNA-binding NarL/FixJ family response regulator